MNLVSAIRKLPINAARITFLEEADAMDAELQVRNESYDLIQLNWKIDIKQDRDGQQKTIKSIWRKMNWCWNINFYAKIFGNNMVIDPSPKNIAIVL